MKKDRKQKLKKEIGDTKISFFSSGFEIYIFQSLSAEKSAKSSLNFFLSEIISANFHSIFVARETAKERAGK